MRATYWICLGLCAGALALAGCKDLDQCDDPGAVEACACAGDSSGARMCMPEYVWSDCDCGAAVPDSGVTGGMGGMTGGMGGMTGGMGGMTGGMGGMTGGMGGTTGGMGGDDPDAGGQGGMGGQGGGGSMGMAYGPCTPDTAEADCGPNAECRESDLQLSGEPLHICTPSCAETDDCPAAPAGGAATLECTGGSCLLACDAFTECPTGLTCAAKDLGTFTCYDDGM